MILHRRFKKKNVNGFIKIPLFASERAKNFIIKSVFYSENRFLPLPDEKKRNFVKPIAFFS